MAVRVVEAIQNPIFVIYWPGNQNLVRKKLGNFIDSHVWEPCLCWLMQLFVCRKNVSIYDWSLTELYTELQFDNQTFRVTSIVHPSTYLNKIVFGSHQGALQLWNIRTSELLFTFKGWESPVTVLEQVGLKDSMIHF